MIHVWTGMPGSGKTTKLARVSLKLFRRNEKYFQKTGKIRPVFSNLPYSQWVVDKYGKYIHYWTELHELEAARDVDVIWQEMANYIDAKHWETTTLKFRKWIRLHRHYGVDIYGDTQDFLTIDNSVRRLTGHLYRIFKVIGSRDKSATRPAVKTIWGFHILRGVDPRSFDKEALEYSYTDWRIMFNDSFWCSVFDSYMDISSPDWPALTHIERYCTDPTCPKFKQSVITHK